MKLLIDGLEILSVYPRVEIYNAVTIIMYRSHAPKIDSEIMEVYE
jgi:hypothetical protein